MIFEIANEKVREQDKECVLVGSTSDEDDGLKHFNFFGNYNLSVSSVHDDGESSVSTVKWNRANKKVMLAQITIFIQIF